MGHPSCPPRHTWRFWCWYSRHLGRQSRLSQGRLPLAPLPKKPIQPNSVSSAPCALPAQPKHDHRQKQARPWTDGSGACDFSHRQQHVSLAYDSVCVSTNGTTSLPKMLECICLLLGESEQLERRQMQDCLLKKLNGRILHDIYKFQRAVFMPRITRSSLHHCSPSSIKLAFSE